MPRATKALSNQEEFLRVLLRRLLASKPATRAYITLPPMTREIVDGASRARSDGATEEISLSRPNTQTAEARGGEVTA